MLGPSGSGKSTLLRLVAGFDRPSAGQVRVDTVDVGSLGGWGAASFRSRAIGYADQHYWRALASELTIRELVGVQLGLAGVSRRQREERADELLDRVGLGARRDAHPRELSGGEQQRVALSAALAHRPRLLIADEPTGELDAATAREVFGLISELVREGGGTALVVSHDPASTESADRVVHVRDGRVSDERLSGSAADGTIVVGRGGWLRLPEDLLRAAGIEQRASARLEPGGVVVSPVGGEAVAAPALRADVAVAPATRGDVVLEARSLRRSFGSTTPFEGLSASFAAGRLYAVTGPSGSGKTTLLHLLAGLDLPDDGDVLLDGVSLGALDRAGRAELRRTSLAFVGQAVSLVPFLGARENVELALALRGADPGSVSSRVAAALASVGLEEHAERPVGELSAGQRQRVALARALAARPRAIVADEPTARLDGANALALGTLLAELARSGETTVICATHDPLLIEQADEELSLGSR